MKKKNILKFGTFALALLAFGACHNSEQEFDDFDYTAVYFAYQSPVRTIVIGEDVYDTTLDNEHKFMVYAVMGGCYSNDKKVTIDVEVANDLCEDLYFSDGSPVNYLPEDYYTMESDQIILDKSLNGGVVVQLTDKFFADPLAVENSYVLPLRMVNVTNADKILEGEAAVDNPSLFEVGDWDVAPMNYTLYCVKYINQWHANYLRRGVDNITIGGQTTEVVRQEEYVEYDEVCSITTKSYTEALFPVEITDANGLSVTCDLILSFDGDNCTITTETNNFTASGTGEFKVDGELNSWGNEDRDAIYLNYTINYNNGEVVYQTTDTLVVRDRGISLETFTPSYEPII
ncbi:MAG: DUF5627 domain-containing protein [Rikenellaceae bacterium]